MDTVTEVAGEVDVLLDEEDGDAGLLADLGEGFVKLGDGRGGKSSAGFVEDEELGLFIESEMQGELVALAAAQCVGALM